MNRSEVATTESLDVAALGVTAGATAASNSAFADASACQQRGSAAGAASGSTPPAAPKKNGTMQCQAQGCTADLTLDGKYCMKRRVCRQHLKAESLMRKRHGSELWRFCQQCGKLELLSCFDGKKRSCRAQLERRMRKNSGRSAAANPSSSAALGMAMAATHAAELEGGQLSQDEAAEWGTEEGQQQQLLLTFSPAASVSDASGTTLSLAEALHGVQVQAVGQQTRGRAAKQHQPGRAELAAAQKPGKSQPMDQLPVQNDMQLQLRWQQRQSVKEEEQLLDLLLQQTLWSTSGEAAEVAGSSSLPQVSVLQQPQPPGALLLQQLQPKDVQQQVAAAATNPLPGQADAAMPRQLQSVASRDAVVSRSHNATARGFMTDPRPGLQAEDLPARAAGCNSQLQQHPTLKMQLEGQPQYAWQAQKQGGQLPLGGGNSASTQVGGNYLETAAIGESVLSSTAAAVAAHRKQQSANSQHNRPGKAGGNWAYGGSSAGLVAGPWEAATAAASDANADHGCQHGHCGVACGSTEASPYTSATANLPVPPAVAAAAAGLWGVASMQCDSFARLLNLVPGTVPANTSQQQSTTHQLYLQQQQQQQLLKQQQQQKLQQNRLQQQQPPQQVKQQQHLQQLLLPPALAGLPAGSHASLSSAMPATVDQELPSTGRAQGGSHAGAQQQWAHRDVALPGAAFPGQVSGLAAGATGVQATLVSALPSSPLVGMQAPDQHVYVQSSATATTADPLTSISWQLEAALFAAIEEAIQMGEQEQAQQGQELQLHPGAAAKNQEKPGGGHDMQVQLLQQQQRQLLQEQYNQQQQQQQQQLLQRQRQQQLSVQQLVLQEQQQRISVHSRLGAASAQHPQAALAACYEAGPASLRSLQVDQNGVVAAAGSMAAVDARNKVTYTHCAGSRTRLDLPTASAGPVSRVASMPARQRAVPDAETAAGTTPFPAAAATDNVASMMGSAWQIKWD